MRAQLPDRTLGTLISGRHIVKAYRKGLVHTCVCGDLVVKIAIQIDDGLFS
jgi:hypothetical protein